MKGIMTDSSGDIMFDGQDFLIGDIDGQTAEDIVTAHAGEFKEKPVMGFGAARMLGGNMSMNWKNEMRESLRQGLISAKEITIDNEGISIEI